MKENFSRAMRPARCKASQPTFSAASREEQAATTERQPRKDGRWSGLPKSTVGYALRPARIALVCDWLTTPGGAEKVLLELHRMYPSAPIYTSQYRKKGIDWFADATVKTGWLNLFPACLRKFLGPLRQLYFSRLDLSDYDLVISVTGAEAKAIKTRKGKQSTCEGCAELTSEHEARETRDDGLERRVPLRVDACPNHHCYHLCYCHVPTQYYWHLYDEYLKHPGFGPLNPLARLGIKLLVGPLRRADYAAAQLPDKFVTISSYAAAKIKKYYDRPAEIVPPPVAVEEFMQSRLRPKFSTDFSTGYYVISCRQSPWKRVDLAIEACIKLKRPLLVIGDGSEHANLVRLASEKFSAASALKTHKTRKAPKTKAKSARAASRTPKTAALAPASTEPPHIQFLPWLSASDLAAYLEYAKGYIFPSLEPFGIAAVEALAAGCPVIAYAEGGSRDFIEEGKNGVLFSKQSVDSLVAALETFESKTFDPAAVKQSAAPYEAKNFQKGIECLIPPSPSSAPDPTPATPGPSSAAPAISTPATSDESAL